MDLRNQSSLERNKAMEETEEVVKWASRELKEDGILTKIPLSTTTASSPCSSPSHEFSFTISFHSPSAAKSSPSTLSRYSAFDPAPADDIFFHGHLLPLQLLSGPPPTSSPRGSRASQGTPAGTQERDVGQSRGDAAADAVTSANANSSNSSSSSSSSSSAASSNGDAKERSRNKFLSSLFTGKWRKAGEAGEREEEEEEKKRKRRAFDAMSKLLRRYMSAVEPLFSFRGGGRGGRRGDPLRRRPYSFAGNPSAGAAAGRGEEWRRRRAELSAPASMRTSPSNSGLLVAPPAAGNVGGSSEESTMEELRSAIEAAIAHCKSSVAMKEEKCKC